MDWRSAGKVKPQNDLMVTGEVNCQGLEITEEMLSPTEVAVVKPALGDWEVELELSRQVMLCKMELEAGQVVLLVWFTKNITEKTGEGSLHQSPRRVEIVGAYRAPEDNADGVGVEVIVEVDITGAGIKVIVDRCKDLSEVGLEEGSLRGDSVVSQYEGVKPGLRLVHREEAGHLVGAVQSVNK